MHFQDEADGWRESGLAATNNMMMMMMMMMMVMVMVMVLATRVCLSFVRSLELNDQAVRDLGGCFLPLHALHAQGFLW